MKQKKFQVKSLLCYEIKKNKIVPKNTKPAKLNVLAGFAWSWWTDSNPRPADYKSAALPAELHQHMLQVATQKGLEPSTSSVTG